MPVLAVKKSYISILVLVLSILISFGGLLFYINEKDSVKEEKANELKAITELKIKQISEWYLDQMKDANLIGHKKYILDNIQRLLNKGDNAEELNDYLKEIRDVQGYRDIYISTLNLKLLATTNKNQSNFSEFLHPFINSAILEAKATTTDIYFNDSENKANIDFISPVVNNRKVVIAVIILNFDPDKFLSQLVKYSPTLFGTSGSMLLRKDKDSVVFLTDIKTHRESGLQFKYPLYRTELPAVQAVLGYKGIYDGKDFRGNEVLSYVNKVPYTPWYIVTKIDKTDMVKSMRYHTYTIIGFTLLLILLVSIVLALIYRSKQINLFKALRDSEEKFKAAYFTSPDSININKLDGTYINVNHGFTEIMGYNEDEVIGKLSTELEIWYIPDDRKKFTELLTENNTVDNYETIFRAKDGTLKTGLISAKLITINNEPHILSIARDITSRKETEDALKLSEQNYREIFNSTYEAIFIHDAETGSYTDVNDAMLKMYGYESFDEIKDKSIADLSADTGEYTGEQALKHLQNTMNQGPQTFEWIAKRKDGTEFWIEVTLKKTLISGEKKILAVARDIGERKLALEALKDSETKYRLLVDHSSDLIWSLQKSRIITYLSPSWLRVTGYLPESLIGKSFTELFHPDDLISIYEYFSTLYISKQSSLSPEYRIKHTDGNWHWHIANGSSVFDEKGTFISFVGISRDITERKDAEKELLFAKQKAEESDRLKTAFLQNMSHEIRTPLNGIIGFSNLLNDLDNSREDISEYTSMIQQSGKRLLEIVNNILDLSKIETGLVKTVNISFSINSLLSSLFSFFNPIAEVKGLQLICNNMYREEETIAVSDEIKLNQIFTNLLNNAIKFTHEGSIEFGYLIIGEDLQFYVKDSGIGINTEMRKRIFERFTQAEESISRQFEGAGLGLAISKGLVELLGGKIWVNSNPGKGSIFHFTIPFIPAEASGIELEEIVAKPIFSLNRTILIADDDITSFKFLKRVLKELNLTLLHAENGIQAVEFVKNTPEISLVLMDIRMPVMDGYEAIPLIKKLRPELPIIAQTAYAFSEERSKIIELGTDDYISKPILRDKLLEMVNKYLSIKV